MGNPFPVNLAGHSNFICPPNPLIANIGPSAASPLRGDNGGGSLKKLIEDTAPICTTCQGDSLSLSSISLCLFLLPFLFVTAFSSALFDPLTSKVPHASAPWRLQSLPSQPADGLRAPQEWERTLSVVDVIIQIPSRPLLLYCQNYYLSFYPLPPITIPPTMHQDRWCVCLPFSQSREFFLPTHSC